MRVGQHATIADPDAMEESDHSDHDHDHAAPAEDAEPGEPDESDEGTSMSRSRRAHPVDGLKLTSIPGYRSARG
jgi:hypothetical protein